MFQRLRFFLPLGTAILLVTGVLHLREGVLRMVTPDASLQFARNPLALGFGTIAFGCFFLASSLNLYERLRRYRSVAWLAVSLTYLGMLLAVTAAIISLWTWWGLSLFLLFPYILINWYGSLIEIDAGREVIEGTTLSSAKKPDSDGQEPEASITKEP